MNVVNFPEIQALFPTPIGIYDLKEKLLMMNCLDIV